MTCRHEGVLGTETFVGVDGRAFDHRFYLVSYRRSERRTASDSIREVYQSSGLVIMPEYFFSKDDEYILYWIKFELNDPTPAKCQFGLELQISVRWFAPPWKFLMENLDYRFEFDFNPPLKIPRWPWILDFS